MAEAVLQKQIDYHRKWREYFSYTTLGLTAATMGTAIALRRVPDSTFDKFRWTAGIIVPAVALATIYHWQMELYLSHQKMCKH